MHSSFIYTSSLLTQTLKNHTPLNTPTWILKSSQTNKTLFKRFLSGLDMRWWPAASNFTCTEFPISSIAYLRMLEHDLVIMIAIMKVLILKKVAIILSNITVSKYHSYNMLYIKVQTLINKNFCYVCQEHNAAISRI